VAFEVNRENASAVAAICWRLAGLPLALELAAARVSFLDPAALLSRLDRALSAGRAWDLPERQRTMRAALDWSHDLLHGPQQELFRRLSVFAGGFTLEAAEAVGAVGGVESGDVLTLLGSLVEQSLVTVEAPTDDAGAACYGMLEPVRQYAREKLDASGDADGVRGAHAAFFLALIGHFSLDEWPKLLKASRPSVATMDTNVLPDDLRSGGRHWRAPKKRN